MGDDMGDTIGTINAAIQAEWEFLATTGTWWTAAERVAIAAACRDARFGIEQIQETLPSVALTAVHKIAVSAHEIDQAWIEGCHAQGLAPLPMVELMALVARVSAVDTCLEGIGAALKELPVPETGTPTNEVPEKATINGGWLPTVGRASAPVCMSAVPAEHRAWESLHTAFYLSIEEMRDQDIEKDLHRSQIELLAARTSLYNDCFY